MTAKSRIRLIGRREMIDFPALGLFQIEAKIDTGAYTSSLHCENLTINYENSKPILYFTVEQNGAKTFRTENFSRKKIKNSFGEMEERFVIKTLIVIGRKRIWSMVSLSNRDNMRYPVLLGRRVLKGRFLIDVSKTHTNGTDLYPGPH
jgi:hypothetical protein